MLKANKAKTACVEQFWSLYDTKNFISRCYTSLTIQEVAISREHEDVEKWWINTWSMKCEGGSIGPFKAVHMAFSGNGSSVESNMTGCVTYSTHERVCFHHG